MVLLATACALPRGGAGGAVADLAPDQRPTDRVDEASLWMHADHEEEALRTSPRLVRDPALQAYLGQVVCRVAGPHCPGIRVYVVREAGFRASMAPNGEMQLRTGLLLRVANEAQLAFVIGHELGHYVRRHMIQRWEEFQAKAVNLRAEAGGLAAFSRDQEREADRVGFELAVKAGYDPRQAPRLWERLLAESAARSTAPLDPFLATHPPTSERLAALRERAEHAAAIDSSRVGRDEYVQQLRAARRWMLNDEVRRRVFPTTEVLLRLLVEDGDGLGELHFFAGEVHRLRANRGDLSIALDEYRQALEHADAPVETHRSRGLVALRSGDRATARAALARYLELAPAAEDRDAIAEQLADLGDAK